jgi:hypothetical protein
MPLLLGKNLNPGDRMRNIHLLRKRGGDKPEWQHTQDFWTETRST